MIDLGKTVMFGRRRGTVVGFTTFKRVSEADDYSTYLVVELEEDSAGYLEAKPNHPGRDCFISFMVVNPSNVETNEEFPCPECRGIDGHSLVRRG